MLHLLPDTNEAGVAVVWLENARLNALRGNGSLAALLRIAERLEAIDRAVGEQRLETSEPSRRGLTYVWPQTSPQTA